MFDVRNGILNGKAQIALGTSYYASFHPDKYPVPPEGDRYGVRYTSASGWPGALHVPSFTAGTGNYHWPSRATRRASASHCRPLTAGA